MTSKLVTLSLFAGLVAVSMSVGNGSRAADISDLGEFYEGSTHHGTNADNEDTALDFDVQTREQNGKFTGIFSGIPVKGKVTSTGKVTFSGSLTITEGTISIKSGKGQLSATGRFIVGSFKVQTKPNAPATGNWTFQAELD